MSFGYQRQPQVMLNDTALLTAYLYATDDQTLVPQANITSVHFTVVKPGDDPATPTINGVSGTVTGDGTAIYVVAANVNTVGGDYKGLAQFSYTDPVTNQVLAKTAIVDYTVIDPLVRVGTSSADGAINQAWMMLEDCFDSEDGGPWLRDMTLAVFDKTKMLGLVPQVLLQINGQMPFTNYTIDSFTYAINDGEALMALGILVQAERQLMRAYTEQPDVVSSPVAFMDRKRYQQAWKAMYDVDSAEFKQWLKQFKLRAFDISNASLLLGSKAGRMLPAPMRSRNVGRGF